MQWPVCADTFEWVDGQLHVGWGHVVVPAPLGAREPDEADMGAGSQLSVERDETEEQEHEFTIASATT